MDGDSSGSGHSPSDETSQKSANMSATQMRSSMKKEPRGSMGSYRVSEDTLYNCEKCYLNLVSCFRG